MPDHPHTIDRWDDATGENLTDRADCRRRGLHGRAGDLPGCGEALAEGQDHPAQPGAGHRAELAAGLISCGGTFRAGGRAAKMVALAISVMFTTIALIAAALIGWRASRQNNTDLATAGGSSAPRTPTPS